MNYLYFVFGLLILIFSGDFLVKGGVQIANHLKIPKLIIGLTIVSVGTSAPELFVSVDAALKGSPDLSIGNVIGSNIANIGLILGITAIILPIPTHRESSTINFPFMMGVSLLLWLLILDLKISFIDGLILSTLLIAYIILLIYRSRKKKNRTKETEQPKLPIWQALLFVIFASIGLYYGAELLVSSAQNIALTFGISERIIGLTIVAFGTSVPELATSVIAALKKQMDISIGNIIGSNIFNILSVLGITSLIKPINVNPAILSFDIYVMIGISALLFFTMLPLRNGKINNLKGGLLLSCYLGYIGLLFLQ